jgi:hypothetical protein
MNALDSLIEFVALLSDAAATPISTDTDSRYNDKASSPEVLRSVHEDNYSAPCAFRQHRIGSEAVDWTSQRPDLPQSTIPHEHVLQNARTQPYEPTFQEHHVWNTRASYHRGMLPPQVPLGRIGEPNGRFGLQPTTPKTTQYAVELPASEPWPPLQHLPELYGAPTGGQVVDRSSYEPRCWERRCNCQTSASNTSRSINTSETYVSTKSWQSVATLEGQYGVPEIVRQRG